MGHILGSTRGCGGFKQMRRHNHIWDLESFVPGGWFEAAAIKGTFTWEGLSRIRNRLALHAPILLSFPTDVKSLQTTGALGHTPPAACVCQQHVFNSHCPFMPYGWLLSLRNGGTESLQQRQPDLQILKHLLSHL